MRPSIPLRLNLDVNALRGPRAISPLTYAIAIPGLFLNTFEAELILPGSSLVDASIIAAVSALASGLVLLAADKTVLRGRTSRLLPLAVVLGVYIVCGIVRALVASASAAAVDAQGPEFTVRSFAGVVLVVAWLSIIAVALDYADRYRESTEILRQRQAELTLQRDYFGVALEQGRTGIGALVDSVVEPAIVQSEVLMRRFATSELSDPESQAAQLADLAREVRDKAEGQVRTLSHVLASDEPQLSETQLLATMPELKPAPGGHWFRRAVKQASVADPIQPMAVTLTVLVEAIPLFTYLFGFRGLAQCAVVGSAVTYGFLWLARRVVTPRLVQWPQAIRIAVLLAVVICASTLATASLRLWWPPQVDELIAIWLRTFWVFLVATIVWAVIAACAAQVVGNRRELAATVAAIEWQVDALRAELSAVQRSAADLVHGRVQGRIIAAAMTVSLQARKLEKGDADAQAATPLVLAEAVSILGSARSDLRELQAQEASSNAATIEDLLGTVAHAWDCVVAVDVDIEPAAARVIDTDSVLQLRVTNVSRELVANAARHGAARSVQLSVALVDSSIVVTAVDDGLGLKSGANPGLGSRQIADAGASWVARNRRRSGATVTVTFPPSPQI